MTTALVQHSPLSLAIDNYLRSHPETNLSALARQCRRDESVFRSWLNERRDPAWTTLVEIAPYLPDELLMFLMHQLGGGRFVPEPIESAGHVGFCIVANSIELIQDAADASQMAAEYGGDSFVTVTEAEDLDGFYVRIIRKAKSYRVGLRSIAGRSIRAFGRGRA